MDTTKQRSKRCSEQMGILRQMWEQRPIPHALENPGTPALGRTSLTLLPQAHWATQLFFVSTSDLSRIAKHNLQNATVWVGLQKAMTAFHLCRQSGKHASVTISPGELLVIHCASPPRVAGMSRAVSQASPRLAALLLCDCWLFRPSCPRLCSSLHNLLYLTLK